jgi:hypothetical protein
MRRLFAFVLLGLMALSSCKSSSSDSYVVLDFVGVLSTAATVASISVELEMGGEKSGTTFTSKSGGISLPTDATLRIVHGSGHLKISAIAKAADGQVLGTGSGEGDVVDGETQHIEVHFGESPDAGAGKTRDASPDLGSSSPTGGNGGTPSPNGGTGGHGGLPQGGLTAGGAGAVTSLAVDAGALGGQIQDANTAAPDAPIGGTMGGASGVGGTAGGSTGGSSTEGTGVASIISEPSSLLFATVTPGQPGDILSSVVRNAGTAAGPPLVLELSPSGGPFSISRDTCSGKVLGPGATCNVTVAFNPTTTGVLNGRISVKAGSVSGTDIVLKGTGGTIAVPELTLQPTQADYPQVAVGTRGSVAFTVTNSGTGPATNLLASNTGAPIFQMNNDQCSGRTLQSGTSCTFSVLFIPATSGPANGSVTVKASELSAPLVAGLTGTGKSDGVPLTVNLQGTGGGTVNAPGLTCQGTVCSGQYEIGSAGVSITLTAKPDGYSSFVGWSGGPCNDTGITCTFVLNGPIVTNAKFMTVPAQVGLNALGVQGNTGTISSSDGVLTCSGVCPPAPHPRTSRLTLVATPAAGSSFIGWSDGPCQGTNPTCNIPLTGDISVTGTFGPQAYMFVTSTTVVPGKLGGLAGADAECAARAQAGGLPGTYRAWLSSSAATAKSRVGSGGWVRVDGRPFARNIASLAVVGNQVVYYPPRIDELGRETTGETLVVTGSRAEGAGTGETCGDYTSTSGAIAVGNAIGGSGLWSYAQVIAGGCSNSYRLYCFNADATGDIRPTPRPGKRLFLSKDGWSPAGGVSGADDVCRSDAATANLPNANAFVALLATSTTAASGRLIPDAGPWKRLDDVVVFRTPKEMASNVLLAAPALLVDGTYGDFSFWSGASGPSQAGLRTTSCQDWSSFGSLDYGMTGRAALSGTADWFAVPGKGSSCDSTGQRVLCVEP